MPFSWFLLTYLTSTNSTIANNTINMPGLSKDTVLSMITEFINDEANMKSVIEMCAAKTTENLRDNLETLRNDMCNHLDSLESAKNILENKLESVKTKLEKRINELECNMAKNTIHMDLLVRKLDDTEQYTRRPNLIIDGVYLNKNESPSSLRRFIVKEIESMDIGVYDEDVDRVHRVEEPFKDNYGNLVQPVIIRFTTWSCRNLLYSARRDFRFRLRADLTARRQQIRDFALDYISANKLDNVVDFVAADRNCRLILRSTAGAFHSFSSEEELKNIADLLVSPGQKRVWNELHENHAPEH